MANNQCLVQPLKARADEYGVSRKNRLIDSRQIDGGKQISISREAHLKARDDFGSGKQSQIVGLVILVIDYVLHGFLGQRRA